MSFLLLFFIMFYKDLVYCLITVIRILTIFALWKLKCHLVSTKSPKLHTDRCDLKFHIHGVGLMWNDIGFSVIHQCFEIIPSKCTLMVADSHRYTVPWLSDSAWNGTCFMLNATYTNCDKVDWLTIWHKWLTACSVAHKWVIRVSRKIHLEVKCSTGCL